MKPPEPLDPRLAELFRKEPLPQPSALAHARVLARLGTAIRGLESAPRPDNATSLSRSGPLGSKAVALAVSTFVGGALLGGFAVAKWQPVPPPRVVYVDRPTPPSPNVSSAPRPEPADSASPASSAPVPGSRRNASPSAASGEDVSIAERLLIDGSRTKLATGEPTAALESLREHERRFPHGQLAEEREALAVQALVQLGQYDAARVRAKQLHNRWPNSVFLQAVDTTIQSIP